MPFDLGNAFAVIGLDTAPMKAGSSVVGGIVDEINGHLSRIGDIAAGVALGESIRSMVRDLEELPRGLFEVQKQFEQFHAGLTGLFEAMAQQVPLTWEQTMAAIEAATSTTRDKVTRSAEDMADAVASHDRQVSDAATQRSQALANEQAALQSNSERLGQAQETFQGKLAGYSETFHDTMDRINANFNTAMENLEVRHSNAVGKINEQIASLAVSYTGKVEQITAKAGAQFGAISEKHAQAVAQVTKQLEDENGKFDDANVKRQRSLDESVVSASKSYARALEQANTDTTRIFQDGAEAIEAINKRLSAQMTDIRQQELDLARSFSQKMEDLTAKNRGALTSQQQSDLARDQQRLIADNSSRQAALANREKQAQSQAGDAVEKVEQDEAKKLAAVTKRMEDERQKYSDQLVKIYEHYDQETAAANKSHSERLEDLTQKQALELAAYRANQLGIAAAEAEALDAAKAAYDQKLQELAAALNRESGAYDLHSKQLQVRRDDEVTRAKDQYDKQVATATLTYQHEVDTFSRSRVEIERRYAESVVRMDEHDANREAAFASRMRKMEERQAQFLKKIEDETKQLTDKYENIGKTGAELFTQPWIDKANQLEEKFKTGFSWHVPDAALASQEQSAEKIKQIDDYLLILDQRTGVALPKLRQGFFELLAGGVDPVKDGVLNIVATLAALPQGRGNIDAISRAFIELSEGGFGRAQRELRQFGINLATITTDNGTFILNEQHRLNTAMGVTQQEAWNAIIKSVSITTDAIAKNLQGTALQLITTLQTMWIQFEQIAGDALFKNTKQAMSDFITFMRENQASVTNIAMTIGNTLGDMTSTIFAALKRLGQPDAIAAIGTFLVSLGQFKDAIIDTIQQVLSKFIGGGREQDIFTNLTRFSGVIEAMGNTLRESAPTIASTIKSLADNMGQFIHDVLQWFSEHGEELKKTVGDVFEAITFGIRSVAEYFDTHHDEVKIVQDWFGQTVLDLSKLIDTMAKFSIASEQFIHDNTPLVEFLGKLTIFGHTSEIAAIADFFNKFIGWLNQTKDTLGETKDQLANFAGNIVRAIDPAAIVTQIGVWASAVADAFKQAFRVITAATSLGLSELPSIVKGVLDNIYGHSIIEDWFASLEIGFAAGMGRVVDRGVEAFNALPGRMQGVLDNAPSVYQPAANPYTGMQSPVDYTGNVGPGANPTGTSRYPALPDDMLAPTNWGISGAHSTSPDVQGWAIALQLRRDMLSGRSGGAAGGGTGGGGIPAAFDYRQGGNIFGTPSLGGANWQTGSMGSQPSYWDTAAGKAFMAADKAVYDKTPEGRARAEGKALIEWFDTMENAAAAAMFAPKSPEQMAAARAKEAADVQRVNTPFDGFGKGVGRGEIPGRYPNAPTLADQRQAQDEMQRQGERQDKGGDDIQALIGRMDALLDSLQKKQPKQGGGDTFNFEKIVVPETAVDFLAEAVTRLQTRLQNRG